MLYYNTIFTQFLPNLRSYAFGGGIIHALDSGFFSQPPFSHEWLEAIHAIFLHMGNDDATLLMQHNLCYPNFGCKLILVIFWIPYLVPCHLGSIFDGSWSHYV